jgi:hypothetical protein
MPGTISSLSLSTFAIRRGQDVMPRHQPRAGMGDVARLRSMLAVPVAVL